ncbi:MAG: NAD-dependent epimerase/dehydratase family protein [Comamonadaceae bacterium]|nr:MAG: NAD-dependent epimerase/dehydratase family protein [Comamonadaceae bacterium]
MTRRILVTGASGFVGQALVAHLVGLDATEVIAMMRATPAIRLAGARYVAGGDMTAGRLRAATLEGVEVIVHAAARVHVLNDDKAMSATEFDRVNVTPTLELARQAVAAGVRRFVFLSSIGVNGVQTDIGKPFTEADPPNPHNPYANSKLKAEQGLLLLSEQSGLEVVIIRPPLVYGPGVRANFAALMRAVQRGWPLPLACVHNLRSMVAMDNLVSFIATCVDHPQAANTTFLVSDGQDISSPDLVRGLAQALGVAARLVPVPVSALQFVGRALGRGDVIQRVCGNLRVDISKARRVLAWQPPVSMDEGLRRTVAGMHRP